jgi:hypothetical protein
LGRGVWPMFGKKTRGFLIHFGWISA